jgi:hypothetical protein
LNWVPPLAFVLNASNVLEQFIGLTVQLHDYRWVLIEECCPLIGVGSGRDVPAPLTCTFAFPAAPALIKSCVIPSALPVLFL